MAISAAVAGVGSPLSLALDAAIGPDFERESPHEGIVGTADTDGGDVATDVQHGVVRGRHDHGERPRPMRREPIETVRGQRTRLTEIGNEHRDRFPVVATLEFEQTRHRVGIVGTCGNAIDRVGGDDDDRALGATPPSSC